jgi:transcriptional regulator with XRE-family HTH domain
MRKRIRDRMDELHMTGRELAKACGHSDAWISGILVGRDGLHWSDFDKVANKLGLSPSELVRHDDSEVRELTPTEMRLLRHYQSWPKDIQERWLALVDFFSAGLPDRETAEVLDRVRSLPASFRRPVLGWFSRCLLTGNIPLEEIAAGGGDGSIAATVASDSKHQNPPAGKRRGDQRRSDGR